MKVPFSNFFKRAAVTAMVVSKNLTSAPQPAFDSEKFERKIKEEMTRVMDAALTDQYNVDLKPSYGAANSERVQYAYQIRARNRTIANTSHGAALIRTFQNNVVGADEFTLEMNFGDMVDDTEKPGNKTFKENHEVNSAICEAWKLFGKKKNFTTRKTMGRMEALRMVVASQFRDGNVFCRKFRNFPGNEFGFAVDFIEEDHVQEVYNGVSGISMGTRFGAGNPIRQSIEYDKKWGFPVAYWILTRHPGDVLSPQNYIVQAQSQTWREQVPAADVVHFSNLRNRAEQDCGMSEMAFATLPLWRLHQYEKALTLAATINASIQHWIEQPQPTGIEPPASDPANIIPAYGNFGGANGPQGPIVPGAFPDPSQSQQGVPGPTTTTKPGSERTLPPGFQRKESRGTFPQEAAHNFRLDLTRDIAVATGAPYQFGGDFQNLGFIAGLMCMIPAQDNWMCWQENIIDGGLDDIFADWLRCCILNGYFEKKGVNVPMSRYADLLAAAKFKGRRWPFVNPLVQAQALILLNEAGHLTRQQVQDMLPDGMSFEKLCEVFSKENSILAQHGLDWNDVDVTRPTISKGEPGQETPAPSAEAATQPPAKSKVANPVRGLEMPRNRVSLDAVLKMSANGEH